MKIYVTVTASDWFEDKPIELDIKRFEYFSLECQSLLWTLHCWTGKQWEKQQIVESHDLAPNQSISRLIDELDIREIKSAYPNSNRTIKSLFTRYREAVLSLK
jgi:hypothetical protein